MNRLGRLIIVNATSALRLPMAVGVVVSIAHYHWVPAAAILLLGLASDQIDGYLARRWGVATRLGYHLDAQSDRILVSSPLIGMMIDGDLPYALGVCLIAGLWVSDFVADHFPGVRVVCWTIIYATITWGLLYNVSAKVSAIFLIVALVMGAGVMWLKRDTVAEGWNKRSTDQAT